MEGIYLNITKTTYNKPTINIILKGENSKHILQDLLMSTLDNLTEHRSGECSHSNQRRKKNKSKLKRESNTVTVCRYTENPRDATRKLRELISESGKFAGYKIDTQKSLAFVPSNNERSEKNFIGV